MNRLEFAGIVLRSGSKDDYCTTVMRCKNCPYNKDTPETSRCSHTLVKKWAEGVWAEALCQSNATACVEQPTKAINAVPPDSGAAVGILESLSKGMVDTQKKWQNKTKGGHLVRIYAEDGARPFPIHGAIYRNLEWDFMCWTASGCISTGLATPNPLDLVPVKKQYRKFKTLDELAAEYDFLYSDKEITVYADGGDEYHLMTYETMDTVEKTMSDEWLKVFTKLVDE